MLFGDKVRMMADERGLSQKDLVERSGMSQPRVSMIMRNKVPDPRLETIVLMAKALDVSVSELVDGVTIGTQDKGFVYYFTVEIDDAEEE